MVSTANPENIAHGGDMEAQVPGNLALSICISLNCLSHLLVSLLSVLEYTLVKDFIKLWSVCVPLAPRYLRHILVLSQMSGEGVYEFVFAQDDLPLDIEHDGFFADAPFDELAVFLLRLASFPAELP